MSSPTLYIVGTPLSEEKPLTPQAIETLKKCEVIVGESKPVLDRYLKNHGISAERFHLDPPRRDEEELLKEALTKLSKTSGTVALLSDVGLPLLFDPGKDVLDFCRKLGFQVRTAPGPTSWATACAVSGWNPPFLIQGFLSRDTNDRKREMEGLKASKAHLVLMETPYRFRKFLSELETVFGPKRPAFLAWEISNEGELYFWGTLSQILRFAESKNLEKGEFVLLLQAQSK